MSMVAAQTERIRDIVLELLELEDADVTPTSLFREDHGVDSLSLIEVQAALEQEFRLVIDNEVAGRMVNLATVCEVVAETLADQA